MMDVGQRAQKAKKNKLDLYDLAFCILHFKLLYLGWILQFTKFLFKETDQNT